MSTTGFPLNETSSDGPGKMLMDKGTDACCENSFIHQDVNSPPIKCISIRNMAGTQDSFAAWKVA